MTPTPFWDRIAEKYAKKPIDDPDAYRAKLDSVTKVLQPTDRVLEVGCGTGSTALQLAPRVLEYVATDGSAKMIAIAQAKLNADAPTNVIFKQADAARLPADRKFDAVLAFSLLHLVDDLSTVLEQIRDQLRPGGLFISKTPCLKDAAFPLRPVVFVMRLLGRAPRVTFLSRRDLVQAIETAGFEIRSSTYFDARRMSPFVVAQRPAE